MGELIRHNGPKCAEIASVLLIETLRENLKKVFRNPKDDTRNCCSLIEAAIKKTFAKIDFQIGCRLKDMALETGCTALVILHIDNFLFCANIGDSQAFVMGSENCSSLSMAHTPVA